MLISTRSRCSKVRQLNTTAHLSSYLGHNQTLNSKQRTKTPTRPSGNKTQQHKPGITAGFSAIACSALYEGDGTSFSCWPIEYITNTTQPEPFNELCADNHQSSPSWPFHKQSCSPKSTQNSQPSSRHKRFCVHNVRLCIQQMDWFTGPPWLSELRSESIKTDTCAILANTNNTIS